MIVDANQIQRGARIDCDVCIVGTGAAGIALALRLSDSGLKVVLLEAGDPRADGRRQQALYEGEVVDAALHSPPDKYRQRRLGGSTTIWGGRCVPFDPVDFERREHVPLGGWPVAYEEVARYYPAATALAEAGRCDYSADTAFAPRRDALVPGFESDVVTTTGLERFSCPTDFWRRYGPRLRVADNVTVLTGANCRHVRLAESARRLSHFDVCTLAGNEFTVAPKAGVVAAGGLETVRLLLASNDVARAGIGNEHDVVGRYYMCHIAGSVGTLTLNGPPSLVRHGYEVSPEGIYCRRRFALTAEAQRRLGVANACARLHFSKVTDPSHRNGVLSTLSLAKSLISYEYGKRLNDGHEASLGTTMSHLRNVVCDIGDTTAFMTHWLLKRKLSVRKFPSVILRNRTNRFSFEINAEQQPLAHSRVSLADAKDELGMPRLKVDWRYAAADIDSVRKTLEVFAEEFRRTGTGRYEFDPATLEEDLTRFGAYGGHHIGTARMGTDLRTSVVDGDCQVHGVAGLYVAGSAVFPTSSQANPTLTLLALSLRLGDHLLVRLAGRPVRAGEPAGHEPAAPAMETR